MTGAATKDRRWIEDHIPQQGRMALLDGVLQWSDERLLCRASSHTDLDHPLRSGGRLGPAVAIEYAAQAMAIHAALLAEQAPAEGGKPAVGYLTSARDLQCSVERLDDLPSPLLVRVERLSAADASMLYGFSLHGPNQQCWASGRATVWQPVAQGVAP